MLQGTWVTHSVKQQSLDLNSSLDIRIMSSPPALGSVLGVEYIYI